MLNGVGNTLQLLIRCEEVDHVGFARLHRLRSEASLSQVRSASCGVKDVDENCGNFAPL